MKKRLVSTILTVVLCTAVLWISGCGPCDQPGETVAEGNRRHLRNMRINRQEMMEDIDHFMLLEQPSKLTGKRMP